MLKKIFLLLFFSVWIFPFFTFADEGMWTYDAVPVKQIEQKYGFAPSKEFLDHLRLSSVNIYASASFVSPDGLILTNHHVALFAAQRMSTPEKNYVKDGFIAESIEKEVLIPGISVRVLVGIEDVTKEIEESVKKSSTPQEAREQREKKISLLESECLKKEGLKGEVVTLFGGAKYSLYKFKEYKEIKLVMIPELSAAFFGGDYDNFTYPRYDLDFAFLRAYENGHPAKTDFFLKVNPNGIKEGDLVFISGHPHETNRLETLAMLEYKRNILFPSELEKLHKFRNLLVNYSQKGEEESRRARTILYYVENGIKSIEGELKGLKDDNLMEKKRSLEDSLKKAVEPDPDLKKEYLDAVKDLEEAFSWASKNHKDLTFKMRMWLNERGLFGSAFRIVTYANEIKKPDIERISGYHDADLKDFIENISTSYPIYKDLEELILSFELEEMAKGLGEDDPFVKSLLQGRTPEEMAKYLVEGTKLDDPSFRKSLVEKKAKGVAKCKDPMIEFAKKIAPTIREMEKLHKDKVQAVEEFSLTRIAKAGFSIYGSEVYPDGTGTLRLSYGKVLGYPKGSTIVPPFTTFYGLFDRAYSFGNRGAFALPKEIERSIKKIDLRTPLNFVCTADITGGNSGSPVVDKEGKLVGVVFDGNAESHPNTFVYDEYQARCVCVDIRAIIEVLKKVYNGEWIIKEMLGS